MKNSVRNCLLDLRNWCHIVVIRRTRRCVVILRFSWEGRERSEKIYCEHKTSRPLPPSINSRHFATQYHCLHFATGGAVEKKKIALMTTHASPFVPRCFPLSVSTQTCFHPGNLSRNKNLNEVWRWRERIKKYHCPRKHIHYFSRTYLRQFFFLRLSFSFCLFLFYSFRHSLSSWRNFHLIKVTVERSENGGFSASGKDGEKREVFCAYENKELAGEITHTIINLITTCDYRSHPSLSYCNTGFFSSFFYGIVGIVSICKMYLEKCESDWTQCR